MIDSGAKILFGYAGKRNVLKRAVEISRRDVHVVYMKETSGDIVPSDGINYEDLEKNDGKFGPNNK